MGMKNKKIPTSTLPFFQEYNFKKLDTKTDKNIIISRLLEYGTTKELQWLFHTYSIKEIAMFLRDRGYRALSIRSFNFWRLILKVKKYNKPEWLEDKKVIWEF